MRGRSKRRWWAVLIAAGLALVMMPGTAAASPHASMQTSAGRPALAWLGNTPTVAWSGTDNAHHLNIGSEKAVFCVPPASCEGQINTFSDTVLKGTGPALAAALVPGAGGQQGIVAWAGTDNPSHIYVGRYNGTSVLGCHTGLQEVTEASPYLVGDGASNNLYLLWRGSDTHLNVARLSTSACTDTGGQIIESDKKTLVDTTKDGPAAAIFNGKLYLAWTGTDVNFRIWTGQFVGTSSLDHHTCLCNLATYDSLALVNTGQGAVRMAYTGTDNRIYVATSTDGTTYPTQIGKPSDFSTYGPDIAEQDSLIFTNTDGFIAADCAVSC